MTEYHLDTSICIDLLRDPGSNVVSWLMANDPKCIKIPAIVEAELYVGVHKSANPQKERWRVDFALQPFDVVPFDSQCAQVFGHIHAQLQREEQVIGPNDTLIAATALANNATLVTHNTREFLRVPGLQVEDWAAVPFE